MVKWIVVMKIQPAFVLMIEENHEKTSVRLVGTGIWTQDLPNASLVRYHGATSLGYCVLYLHICYIKFHIQNWEFSILI